MATVWWSALDCIHYRFQECNKSIVTEADLIEEIHIKLNKMQPALVNRRFYLKSHCCLLVLSTQFSVSFKVNYIYAVSSFLFTRDEIVQYSHTYNWILTTQQSRTFFFVSNETFPFLSTLFRLSKCGFRQSNACPDLGSAYTILC